jgi:hypothetical protein
MLFPREPGELRFNFKLVVNEVTYETGLTFFVERRYHSSLRVGVGFNLTRPARGRDFAVSDGVIVDNSARSAELVVGYVVHPWRFDGIPGRHHHMHYYTTAQRFIPNPYIGLSIVGTPLQGRQGVDLFNAVYLGADWIIVPGLAATLAVRISWGERLRDDYEVGTGVVSDEDFSHRAPGFAPAVILSFYPKFFQFGK